MVVLASGTAFGHFVYVHLAILYAGRDAWISLIVAAFIGVAIMNLHVRFGVSENEPLIEHVLNVFGKWVGSLVAAIYISFFLLINAITIKVVTDFMGIVYPTTPNGIFLLSVFVVSGWVVYKGVEVMGRTMQILLPVLMLLGITAALLSAKDKNFTEIYPILNHGLLPVWRGTLIFVTMFSEFVGFCSITDTAKDFKKLPKQCLIFGAILLVMFLGPITGPVMVFGEQLAKSLAFPTYTEIQYLRIGNVIERLDVIGVVLWTIGSFFRISMFMFASVKGMSLLFHAKRENTYLLPMVLLTSALSLSLMQTSREEIYQFLGSDYVVIAPSVGIGLPLLTGIVAWARRIWGNGQINSQRVK